MQVGVVGAGISGLSLAQALTRHARQGAPLQVTVFEREARVGGVVRSERCDGYLCEHGPDGFLDRADETVTLVHELGLAERLLTSDTRARRRFVYRRGRLRETPSGPGSFLTSDILSFPGRLRAAVEPFIGSSPAEDETIHAFAARRFGKEAADILVDAISAGVFGGDSRQLSLRACFPLLSEMEAEHGSVVRALAKRARKPGTGHGPALGRLVSFPEGIEQLIHALGREVSASLRLRAPVRAIRQIRRDQRVEWELACEDATYRANVVVLATDASSAARLVDSIDGELAGLLREIPSAPLAVLCLGYGNRRAGGMVDGFGFLVPRGEGPRILGAVWESNVFAGRAPDGHALIRVMIGGATDPDALSMDDEALVRTARTDLKTVCHLDAPLAFVKCIRQNRGLPQYVVGHLPRLSRIDERLQRFEGLMLAGNSYRGVALTACIAEARKLADALRARATAAGT
jgi:oxygen-dependent protoporphyrinogen oxidase